MTPLPLVEPPLHVVLVSPQIPPNTGNVARTCAVTGSRLHLVGPLGFSVDDQQVRRAGLDYWRDLRPDVYRGWPEFEARALRGQSITQRGPGQSGRSCRRAEPASFAEKLHLFTAGAARSLFDVRFAPGDLLVFGHEQLGLPPALLAAWPERQVAIPMREGQRSLNLAVAVGVAVYAALGGIVAGAPRGDSVG